MLQQHACLLLAVIDGLLQLGEPAEEVVLQLRACGDTLGILGADAIDLGGAIELIILVDAVLAAINRRTRTDEWCGGRAWLAV